jgi:hypothetical protein
MTSSATLVTRSAIACLAISCAALVLAACSGNKSPTAADQIAAKNATTAVRQRPGNAADLTANMVQAATSGKATAPMQLKFEIAERPIAGQTIDLSVALMATVAAQAVTLHLADSPGIVFADAADRAIGAVVPDTAYRQDIKLSIASEGVYFVGITANMARDSLSETRNFTIPIIVTAQ